MTFHLRTLDPVPLRGAPWSRARRSSLLLAALVAGLAGLAPARAQTSLYLGSKTTYAPQQDPSTYEAPPTGFSTIYTELVARHGSRGLSSASSDLAMYNMWVQAQATNALTKLGARLGPDLQRITRANALLGYNVPGITTPGYGNLTLVGINEHQQLAVRLASRTAPLLANAANTSTPRQVVVSTSGINRAVDSSNFFTQSLIATPNSKMTSRASSARISFDATMWCAQTLSGRASPLSALRLRASVRRWLAEERFASSNSLSAE